MVDNDKDNTIHVGTDQSINGLDSLAALDAEDLPKPTLLSSVRTRLHSGNDFLSELHSKLNAALTLVGVDDDDEEENTDSGGDDWTTLSTSKARASDTVHRKLSSCSPVTLQRNECGIDDAKTPKGKGRRRQYCRSTSKTTSSSASRTPHRLSLTSNHGMQRRSGRHHRSASDTGFVSSAGSVSEAESSEAPTTKSASLTSASTPVAVISQESSCFSLDHSASEGSLISWTSSLSCDSQNEDITVTSDCLQFLKNFIDKLFKNNNTITLEEKAQFGAFCQTEMGRLWFSRYVNTRRVHNKKVDESTFYSLVQYFAIALFECAESDDYTPAKTIMNMCFTYYHEVSVAGQPSSKEFLYMYLREQPIWQSLRFWNAAFFDAVQCERSHKPVATRTVVEQYSPEEMIDEQTFQENITFGQLGSFTCNMHAFGLSRELCLAFLRKQSTIANLKKNHVQMLKDNIERMYRR